jgi:hypothetical protein
MTGNRPAIRWFAAIASFAVILVFGLSGISAAPPAASSVRIVDGTNAAQVAKVDAAGNLQVGGTVGIDSSHGAVPVATAPPANAFSLAGSHEQLVCPELAAGTNWSISSISGNNDHTGFGFVRVILRTDPSIPTTEFVEGPILYVPGQDTRQLTFPQPFVIQQDSSNMCLEILAAVAGEGPVGFTVVGYHD